MKWGSKWRALGLAGIGVALTGACAADTKEGSESHFETCNVDADCSGRKVCAAGECRASSELTDAPVLLPDGGLPNVAACARPNADPVHVANLADFCANIGSQAVPAPLDRCPTDRDDFLERVAAACRPLGPMNFGYPSFQRSCGVDLVTAETAMFYFDTATGALIGGNYLLTRGAFGCKDDAAFWFFGEEPTGECSFDTQCDLCLVEGGGCPPDIAAKLVDSSPRCVESTDGAGSTCTVCPPTHEYSNGLPCDPAGPCASCNYAPGCSTECVCLRDGTFGMRLRCD